jgi:hypothetical protein
MTSDRLAKFTGRNSRSAASAKVIHLSVVPKKRHNKTGYEMISIILIPPGIG